MKHVVIIGAGAHSAEIVGLIYDNNKHSCENEQIVIKGYIDDKDENYLKYKFKEPLLSNIDGYVPDHDDYFILGISNVHSRTLCLDKLKNRKINFLNFIHYTSIIYETAEIGYGNVISCYSKIGPNAKLGNLNSINSRTEIGHDCVVGSNNVFAGSVGIAGYSNVGDNNFFSMYSAVIPNITIGSNNTIQAGMIVDKNIGEDTYFFHRFKEKVLVIPKKSE